MDRFGGYADLQIDSLTKGLNVFHGPPQSGKSTIVQFLRTMFCGFQAEIRRRFLPGESHGWGGTMTLVGPAGELTVSRYDDGGVEGRLTVQDPAGRLLGDRELQDLLPGVLSSTYARLLAVDFDHRPEMSGQLLDEARRLGVEVQVPATDTLRLGQLNDSLQRHREQLAGLSDPGKSLESLRKLRQRLSDEIESLISKGDCRLGRRSQPSFASGGGDSGPGPARAGQAAAQELAEVERAQHELHTRRAEAVQRNRQDRSGTDVELGERLARLRALEARLERWRDVLGDVAQRRQALQADSEDQTSSGSAKTGDPPGTSCNRSNPILGDLSALAAAARLRLCGLPLRPPAGSAAAGDSAGHARGRLPGLPRAEWLADARAGP